jgi:hypothetical protein
MHKPAAARPAETGTWLTKDDAAKRLGISARQIERLAAAGKLRSRSLRLQGERSNRTVYAEADVDAAGTPQAVQLANPGNAFMELLLTRLQPQAAPRAWLTLEEAAEHSGLPASELKHLIRSDEIFTLGRRRETRRIQRASLDQFGVTTKNPPRRKAR